MVVQTTTMIIIVCFIDFNKIRKNLNIALSIQSGKKVIIKAKDFEFFRKKVKILISFRFVLMLFIF